MSEQLHNIDRPDEENKYNNLELDEFMVFCILDTSVPYEKCCQAFDALKEAKMTTRKQLKKMDSLMIKAVLTSVGYRWANQKAKYLKEFAINDIDLKNSSRKEIVNSIKGVGMKLGSMFLRNTCGHEYAVLDVHTLRWLQENYKFPDDEFRKMSYEKKEKYFIEAAEFLSTTPMELDLKIWQENRIGNRNGKIRD